jgi:hypothetical protein
VQAKARLLFIRCIAALLLVGQCSLGWSQTSGNNLCVSTGYTLGFFNGVWNTSVQTATSLAALRVLTEETIRSEPVQYEAFYNSTGSVTGATGLQDVAEVFQQRARFTRTQPAASVGNTRVGRS